VGTLAGMYLNQSCVYLNQLCVEAVAGRPEHRQKAA